MVSPGLPSSSEKGEESTEAAVAPATPADELRVYAALHNLGADLGEPVEVRRSGDRVLVEGVGIAPDIQEKLQRELAALPKVQVDFSRTPASGSQPSENETRSTAILTPHPLVVNWQESMAKQLGGRTGLDKFSEQMLDRVDKLTARAHALRNLALRFPDASVLSEADRATLRQIRADHTRALTAEVGQIRQAMGPVATALKLSAPAADHGFAAWPAGAHVVFQLVRDVESRMAILFGGATGNVTADLPERLFQGLDELGDRAPGLERE